MPVRPLFTFAVLTFLAGCAAPSDYDRYLAGNPIKGFAYKAGTTTAIIQRDKTNCEISAAQRVPPNNVVHSTPGISTPTQTYCNQIGTQTFCNTTGGQSYGGGTYTTDANAGLRQRAYQQCLVDQGYRSVDIPACPQDRALKIGATLPALSRTTCYAVAPDGRWAIGYY